MPSYTQPPYLLEEVRVEHCDCTAPDPGILACEAPAVYRPRHPEATVFYQKFEQHFDSYVRVYEDRFEPRSGPLRRVVPEAVEHDTGGVFETVNGGRKWAPVGDLTTLPNTFVTGAALELGVDLTVSTYGRGMWRLARKR